MADLTVTYLGMEITITDEYCRMREVRSKFDDLAIDAQEIYLERYYKAYEDFQTFANRGISDGYNFLKSYLKNAVDELIQGGVYHADQKMLINTYG